MSDISMQVGQTFSGSTSDSVGLPEAKVIGSTLSKPTTKPGLAVRVGVTGHRDLPQEEIGRLEKEVRTVLARIAGVTKHIFENRKGSGFEIYSDQSEVLRVISPLAEGADRIVAEQALL